MTDSDVVEHLSIALGLPRPHLHEKNCAFALLETWPQLTEQLVQSKLEIRPLGYYRSPEAIDIYVFECRLRSRNSEQKTWKIYRRYRQFQKYASYKSDHKSIIPTLAQSYLNLFYAKDCDARLQSLYEWLQQVVKNTTGYYLPMKQVVDSEEESSFASESYCSDSLKSFDTSCHLDATNPKDRQPLFLLSSFLLAGANHAFPRYFEGLPRFAVPKEQVQIEMHLTSPLRPSQTGSSVQVDLSASLGLKLRPTYEQNEMHFGATVSDVSKDKFQELTIVRIGAKVGRMNGVDVRDEPFEQVVGRLLTSGSVLRLELTSQPSLDLSESPLDQGKSSELDPTRRLRSLTGSTADSDFSSDSIVRPKNRIESGSFFGNMLGDFFGKDGSQDEKPQTTSWDDVSRAYEDYVIKGFITLFEQDDGDNQGQECVGVLNMETGPVVLYLQPCSIQQVHGVMLSRDPTGCNQKNETLTKGMVLVGINDDSTFGQSYADVIAKWKKASRPTTVVFRYFDDYSPFLETMECDVDSPTSEADKEDMYHISNASKDLTRHLQLALTRNVSLRNHISALEKDVYASRMAIGNGKEEIESLEQEVESKDDEIDALKAALATKEKELSVAQGKVGKYKKKVVQERRRQKQEVEEIRKESSEHVKKEEERLLKLSNRSIDIAAERSKRRTKWEVDNAVAEVQKKHDDYLQRLAEEHSEELESVLQQVAVWRHQVDVLTEAERRKCASYNSNAHQSYADSMRQRSHHEDDFVEYKHKRFNYKTRQSERQKGVETDESKRMFTSSSEKSEEQDGMSMWDRVTNLVISTSK